MSTVTVQGMDLQVIDTMGKETPVLFFHGIPDSGQEWSSLIDRLRNSYRCIAPDLPGFGRSPVTPNFEYSLRNSVGFVEDLVTALGITEPVHLVVHDVGSLFALPWAVTYPERIKSVTFTNTAFHSDFRWHPMLRLWQIPLLGPLAISAVNSFFFRKSMQIASPLLPESHIRSAYALFTPSVRKTTCRFLRSAKPEQAIGWEDKLLELTAQVPSIVLWGDRDPFVHKRFSSRFGTNNIHHFPECSHWPFQERTEEFSQKLLHFLDDVTWSDTERSAAIHA